MSDSQLSPKELLVRTLKKSGIIGIGALAPSAIGILALIYSVPEAVFFLFFAIPMLVPLLSMFFIYHIEAYFISKSEKTGSWIYPDSFLKFVECQIFFYAVNFAACYALFIVFLGLGIGFEKFDSGVFIRPLASAICTLPFFFYFLADSCVNYAKLRKSENTGVISRLCRWITYPVLFIVGGISVFPYANGSTWERTRNIYVYGHPEPVDYVGRSAEEIIKFYNAQKNASSRDLDGSDLEEFNTDKGGRIRLDYRNEYAMSMQFVLRIQNGKVTYQWLHRSSDGFGLFRIFKSEKWESPPNEYK